ncbi:MAG TPA: TAXI family TRAP transporter solute-binding subunit, partial [Candidatus Binatia bacterium]|nr:TAXI family TRAP transporter solute-binding subunit [Candidatus Binatia bacterium]
DTCVNAYDIYLTSHKGIQDRIVETVLKNLWEKTEKLVPLHPSFKNWTRQRAVDAAVTTPFHPAAIEFYKARGVWSAAVDENHRKLLALNS